MRPSQDQPGELARPDSARALPVEAQQLEDARLLPHVTTLPAEAGTFGPPAELAGMLLPTESVTFASSPHPIILVRPVLQIVVIAIALAVVLSWQTRPIVHGHHVTVSLVTGIARLVVIVAGALLLLRAIIALLGRLFHFLAYRIVTTNRRVFVVEGLFGRRVEPIGNSALASARMFQGFLGRMFGYGSLMLPTGTGPHVLRDMRDPIRLYREFEAVAQGVEGDTWKQAIRQTQIP